jgi:hypothetical protein
VLRRGLAVAGLDLVQPLPQQMTYSGAHEHVGYQASFHQAERFFDHDAEKPDRGNAKEFPNGIGNAKIIIELFQKKEFGDAHFTARRPHWINS